jgi:hypothetical protein
MAMNDDTAQSPARSRIMSRRRFVTAVGAMAASGLLPLGRGAVFASSPSPASAPRALTLAGFSAYLGQDFRLQDRLSGVTMKLVEVTDRSAVTSLRAARLGAVPGVECFSLTFNGPRTRALSQNTYQFYHPAFGWFPLFIVPMGAASDGLRYEAAFYRLPR